VWGIGKFYCCHPRRRVTRGVLMSDADMGFIFLTCIAGFVGFVLYKLASMSDGAMLFILALIVALLVTLAISAMGGFVFQ